MTRVVEKQVRTKRQKQVDEELLALMDESIETDERLLKRLAKA